MYIYICIYYIAQSVLLPRKIGELELDFEIPTWNSNWDFEGAPQVGWVGRRQAGRAGGGRVGKLESWNWILKIQRPGGRVGNPTGILRNLLFTIRFTINFIINNITQKTKSKNKQK